MEYIKKNFFLSMLIVLTQLFFSLLFVSSNSLTITSKLVYYKQYTIDRNYEDQFVNVEITNPERNISDTFAQFIRNNVSRDKKVVTYYSIYGKMDNKITISSEQNDINFKFNTSILYNPFRYDTGNKYFESFRLRQHFQDVDSRKIKPGYDFTLQLSNDNADLLLSTFGFDNNYTIFKDRLIDLKLNIDGVDYLGYVSNVFYIDEDEPIALHLNRYYTDFSTIIISPPIRDNANFSLNHSFVNTSMRIKQEFEKISLLKMDNNMIISDYAGNNALLNSIYNSITKPNFIDYKILSVGLIGLSLSIVSSAFFLFWKKNYSSFNKLQLALTIFFGAILFSLMTFLGKALLRNEFLYRLSNIYSGVLTLALIVASLVLFYSWLKGKKKVIHE
jgi:hypothetical protein